MSIPCAGVSSMNMKASIVFRYEHRAEKERGLQPIDVCDLLGRRASAVGEGTALPDRYMYVIPPVLICYILFF